MPQREERREMKREREGGVRWREEEGKGDGERERGDEREGVREREISFCSV